MDIYATHIPLLKALPSQYPIKKVIEFGAGIHSTPLFLKTAIYSDVERVVSYEDNLQWYTTLKPELIDKRLELFYVNQPMHESLIPFFNALYLDTFDLIFIDNGASKTERVLLIEKIAAVQPKSLVVIHDFEQREYQHAIKDWPVKIVYSGLEPHTALLMSHHCIYLTRIVQ